MKMTVKALFAMILPACLFVACQSGQKKQEATEQPVVQEAPAPAPVVKDIPFVVAERYFVNNTVEDIDNPKITTKEEFDEIFGYATAMGEDGLPTAIDFTKQYVIAVTVPETDQDTRLIPVSLQGNEYNEIIFSYRIEKNAEKRPFIIKPCLILIVDKEHAGNVVLKEVQ